MYHGRVVLWATAALVFSALLYLLIHDNDTPGDMVGQPSGYSTTRQVNLPSDGLLATERLAAESLKEVQSILSSSFDVVAIHRIAQSEFSRCWGDLRSTSMDIDFAFSGDKDGSLVRRIAVSTPHHVATFEYTVGGVLKICSVTLSEEVESGGLKLGMEFFANGNLKTLAYANQKGEFVRRIVEWREDGSLLRSESLDAPRKPNMIWKGPANRR